MQLDYIKSKIRTVPDFPKKGILFKDITTLISDPKGLSYTIELLHNRYASMQLTKVVGIEARGFIFGSALAHQLKIGFVPIRKKGKLPAKTIAVSYDLEYGQDTIEMHEDALENNDRVILVDDLLATGGTALAAIELISKFSCSLLETSFIINLKDLPGENRLKASGNKFFSLLEY
jgi:adenine phosphoribosyltransferase